MNALTLTPRQLFETSRLVDRIGPAYMAELDGGRVVMWLATRGGEADLALELDATGNVVSRRFLDLAHRDHEDPCGDFGDEQPLPAPVDVRDARPAPLCECPEPLKDGDLCLRCGHTVPVDAPCEVG